MAFLKNIFFIDQIFQILFLKIIFTRTLGKILFYFDYERLKKQKANVSDRQKLLKLETQSPSKQKDEKQLKWEKSLSQLRDRIQSMKSAQNMKILKENPHYKELIEEKNKQLGQSYFANKIILEELFSNNLIISVEATQVFWDFIEYLENYALLELDNYFQQKLFCDHLKIELDLAHEKYSKISNEKFILQEELRQLKEKFGSQSKVQEVEVKHMNKMSIAQLADIAQQMQQKINEMSQKESRLISLVLAIKKTGVDIEKIYNEEILNNDYSIENSNDQIFKLEEQKESQKNSKFSSFEADHSIINDSDESSFHYMGRENSENNEQKQSHFNEKKFKIDLQNISKKEKKVAVISSNQPDLRNAIHQKLIQEDKLKLDFKFEGKGKEPNQFSESLRSQALKKDKRAKII